MSVDLPDFTSIKVVRDGAVDWLTLDRPARLNALDGAMVEELWRYFSDLQSNRDCRIVVMRGAGRGFCAGLDLTWFNTGASMPVDPDGDGTFSMLTEIIFKMRACPQVIVSLVHGPACGGGFNFILASDIRIAARSAKMNVAFVKLGLSGCELGTSYFLPRFVGASVAADLMLTGRFIDGERALATGLVSQLVDRDEDLESAGQDLVEELLAVSPLGLRKTKEGLALADTIDNLTAVIRLEEQTQLACMKAAPFAETVGAFAGGGAGTARETASGA